jgi:Domain of unknown function (DUF4157)/Lysine-specific metallo-endopeptidase
MSEAAALQTQTTKAPPSNSHSLLVQRKCACGGSSGLTGSCSDCEKKKLLGKPLQTKLRINEPGDEYEQEADRVAEQVMRMTAPGKKADATTPRTPLVQWKMNASGAGISTAPQIVYDVLASPGQPLDAGTRAFFEPRFGHNFSQVRVHSDARSAHSARAVDALAYTVGHDIVLGENQRKSDSGTNMRLFAHELSHVIQQTALGHHSSLIQRAAPTQPQGNPQTPKLINCGPAETATLGNDLSNAGKLAQDALDAIAASDFSPLKKQALIRHFGPTAEDQKQAIITRYTNIINSLSQKEITCANSCEKRKGLDTLCAIGYENTNRIKVCPDYWTAGFCKTYSTLLHEAVHNDGGLVDVKMTDPGYPPVNAKDNAYSYEYFAVDFEKPKEEAYKDLGKKPEGVIPPPPP